MTLKLLHWSTLSPQGPSGLSAIRFSVPIRVSVIRIFPSGVQPFDLCPDVIAKTEPETFYLDVFFNAQPLKPAESKEKQRAPNALVPTSIAYAGGQANFTVDLGTEYATRLMIVKGNFDFVSLAIYGEIADAQSPPENSTQIPSIPIPQLQPAPLSRSLDIANARDPTQLASQLLSLTADPPSLSLASRLILCMKPEVDDWDDPDFPHIYADIERELSSDALSLESAVDCLSRPIAEDTSKELMARFWMAVASDIELQNSMRQSSLISKLFKFSASQHPSFALELCLQVDPVVVFDQNTLDSDSLLDLLDAAANADIARHFNTLNFLDILQGIQESPAHETNAQKIALRLSSRIKAWETFEDSLTNTQADFEVAIAMLKDIGSEEQSVGVWLASMTLHDDLVTKLSENPSNLQRYPKLFDKSSSSSVSHDDFIAFVRGYVGIASVFAVWGWADSLGNDPCRERILAVLHLWQQVDGYRELVNFFLLLRQFSLRLKWIASDNEVPRKSGIFGEQMLADLVKDPLTVLNEEVHQTIISLEEPLLFISEAELLSMRKLAYVAEDGLPAAVEEIFFDSGRPLSLRRLRTLRLSLAMIHREFQDEDRGEWRVVETVRDDYSLPLLPRLVQLLKDISSDLNEHFIVSQYPPAPLDPTLAENLFRTVEELLSLTTRLASRFTLSTVAVRALTCSVADIFACTDAAETMFYPSSAPFTSAEATRQVCLNTMQEMCMIDFRVEPNTLGAEVVLRSLLTNAVANHQRDPVYHLQQVFSLVNHILPDPSDESHSEWLVSVLPPIQTETLGFFRLLDLEHKVPFMKRLVELDIECLVGFAEWLLIEELKDLSAALNELSTVMDNTMIQSTIGYQVNQHLQFLQHLLRPKTDALSTWCIDLLSPSSTTPDVPQALSLCLLDALDTRVVSTHLENLVQQLLNQSSTFDSSMKYATLLAGLRMSHRDVDLVQWDNLATLFQSLSSPPVREAGMLRREIGQTFSAISKPGIPLSVDSANAIVIIMEWLVSQGDKFTQLCGFKVDEMMILHEKLMACLPSQAEKLSELRPRLSMDEDELLPGPDNILTDNLEMSIYELESLLERGSGGERPSTPARNNIPDVLGLVFSPPTAVLRSPATTGLTKTYLNNDFRELRQTPTARQNTSRLPSTHVDVGITGQLT
ncbi:hypothetical protein E1B28_004719 [Marasmius oreades]|uniref:Virilizer N-terminal domain-containing protein n=1 Tax=Marasmius oreades TaxID=181124 RepID=A0A9P7UZ67_9AGAR|nr:uncharacterized protein E1B28_004719 [Marasmius oreades]KAG7097369.1 hypothetical protein E1B28_004719 [Marasmius oreades]